MKNKKEPAPKLSHIERPHAPFGGSVAARRIACSGSYFLEAQLPPQPASDAADDGTRAHECCEWALADFLYRKVHGEGVDLDKPKFFSDYEEYANQYVDEVWEKALFKSITGKSYTVETVLTIDEGLGMYGPGDFACVYSDERGRSVGIVGDYKHGFDYVECKKNDQLSHYACGLREEVRRHGKDLEYVRAFIFQPRAGGESYRETIFTAKYLDTWKKKAIKAATQIFVEKKAKFKEGDWCKWCRGKTVCETYLKARSTETQLQLVNHNTIELPKVDHLPPEHVVKLVLFGDKLVDLVNSAKDLARDACLKDGEYYGLKLVNGNGKRGWDKEKDESEIVEILTKRGVKNPLKSSLRGITEIEKELKKTMKPDEVTELMSAFTKKSSPTILVASSDERPAVTGNKQMLESIGD